LKNRSSNGKEKFPAQISLPGGKPEKGEHLLQTAIRETYEETGLDLSNELEFAYLGEFPTILPFMKIKTVGNIYVKAFMFLQISLDPLPLMCNPGEIDDCIWTSVEYFKENPNWFFRKFDLCFFPNTSKEFVCKMPTLPLYDSDKYTLTDLYNNPELLREDFKLWWITLFFIIDFIKFGKYVKDKAELKRFNKYYYYSVDHVRLSWIERKFANYVHKYDPLTHNNVSVDKFIIRMSSSLFHGSNKKINKFIALVLLSKLAIGLSATWLWSGYITDKSSINQGESKGAQENIHSSIPILEKSNSDNEGLDKLKAKI